MALATDMAVPLPRRPAWRLMWLTGIRDLQWRRRRVVIAVLGTALVFGLTLLLAGFRAGFAVEADRTAAVVQADHYYLPSGLSGPFSGVAPVSAHDVDALAGDLGVDRAAPLILVSQQIQLDGQPRRTYLIGHEAGSIGSPPVAEGRSSGGPGEAVVDSASGLALGEMFEVGGVDLVVVGLTEGQTILAGSPHLYVLMEDAQRVVFDGLPVATVVAVDGRAVDVPAGLTEITFQEAKLDIARPLEQAIGTINLMVGLLWMVAAAIIGSVLYLSALEREGDFAVFKATGMATVDLVVSLVLQAVLLSVLAGTAAIGLAYLLQPVFPVDLSLPAPLVIAAPVVAVVVGCVASAAGLRRVTRIDPALAFE